MPPHHHITALVSNLPCPCNQTSHSYALPPATKPVSHLPCPLSPNQSLICLAPCHQTSQSFTCPLVLCPLPPNQSVIWLPPATKSVISYLSPATKPVTHLPCPLPPNQSVIWLALYHRGTTSPCHHMRFSPPHGYESDWLILPNTVLIG